MLFLVHACRHVFFTTLDLKKLAGSGWRLVNQNEQENTN